MGVVHLEFLPFSAAEFGKRNFPSPVSPEQRQQGSGMVPGELLGWHLPAKLCHIPGSPLTASPGSTSHLPCQTCNFLLSSPCDLGFWKPTSFLLIATFPFPALKNYSQNPKSIEFLSSGKWRSFAWESGTCSAQRFLYFPLITHLLLYIWVFVLGSFVAKVQVDAIYMQRCWFFCCAACGTCRGLLWLFLPPAWDTVWNAHSSPALKLRFQWHLQTSLCLKCLGVSCSPAWLSLALLK